MKKIVTIVLCATAIFVSCKPAQPQAEWKPAGDKIMTTWGENLDPANVHPEYPRPQLVRADWMNLNGLWQLDVADKGTGENSVYSGPILVPFAVESALSGVGVTVGKEREMVYTRTFKVPFKWRGDRVMLNFGAVDWQADVYVNDIPVGNHTGGYTPFSMDITDALDGRTNTLTVKVWDPTDDSFQPRGKQINKPEGIWYTPVSGIWQTVWMEPVAENSIADLRITPDIDSKTLRVNPSLVSGQTEVSIKVYDGEALVAEAVGQSGTEIAVAMPQDMRLWSPDEPFLYDLKVTAGDDCVTSYAGMRKISRVQDADGIWRMQLNNKDLFQMGPLDQGWWPDGLYTAPSDEALVYDIVKTKELGFNMIRKNVKVEPARWYAHCDRLGMIVWQDMPSGGEYPGWNMTDWFEGQDGQRSAESEANYYKEWEEIMTDFHSYPSICVWVPFNEAWGQFKTRETAEWTKVQDPSRLVNAASGGNFFENCGDMLDLHKYPSPEMYLYDPAVVNVLGEYGGIGYVMQDHLWVPDRNWGYVKFNSKDEVTDVYVEYAEMLLDLVPKGFSAGVYTQTTDVEIEVNGLMTYDRKQIKIDEARVRQVNERLVRSLDR
jgi:beta-galactosidase/beta-glucuronidase